MLIACSSLHSELGMMACTVNCTYVLRTKTSQFRHVAWPALPDSLDSLNWFLNGLWAIVHSETITAGFSLPGVRTPLRFWFWYTSPVKGFMSLCWEGPFSWVGKGPSPFLVSRVVMETNFSRIFHVVVLISPVLWSRYVYLWEPQKRTSMDADHSLLPADAYRAVSSAVRYFTQVSARQKIRHEHWVSRSLSGFSYYLVQHHVDWVLNFRCLFENSLF